MELAQGHQPSQDCTTDLSHSRAPSHLTLSRSHLGGRVGGRRGFKTKYISNSGGGLVGKYLLIPSGERLGSVQRSEALLLDGPGVPGLSASSHPGCSRGGPCGFFAWVRRTRKGELSGWLSW